MALKKSDLYSSLWSACDELRGPMEPGQYKDYVLVLLFIKYISDKYAGVRYAPITIPEGASFADLVALKGKDDIGDQINKKIIEPLARANDLTDLPDFNDPGKLGSGREMIERLTGLIALFETRLDFSRNRAEGDDILGDAYEYLMRHFATASGKSKGQFYTPAEVSRIMARLIGIDRPNTTNETTVYDPTCGSGSLLLKVADEASAASGAKVTLYGQENEATTAGLARMNMILHDNPTADIRQGNTIAAPHFKDGANLKAFDYVVANPPFSDKRWSTGLTDDNDFGRFTTLGRPPKRQGDYAYLLHIIASLKSTGRGACILPHGVLFRGNAEAVVRRNLVQRGYIKAIVGLPTNLFFGTGIPACLVVIDKRDSASRTGIFMINAAAGFTKDGAKNRLREQDIHRIIDTYRRQADVPGYARLVPVSEIADPKNDFNLNLPRYIESTEKEDIQDLAGHMRGGIPSRDVDALEKYWKVAPGLRATLFEEAAQTGYWALRVPSESIRATISAHPEFGAFRDHVAEIFEQWRALNEPLLRSFDLGGRPKEFIATLSESLLERFGSVELFDPYDIYQGLMSYWSQTFQDDAYMVAADGWVEAVKPREIFQQRNKNNKLEWMEEEEFRLDRRRFKSDLLPASILIDAHLSTDRDRLDQATSEKERLEQEIGAEKEEHAVEGGLLEDVAEFDEDKVKVDIAVVNRWLRENGEDPEVAEEAGAIRRIKGLLDDLKRAKDEMKDATKDLDARVAALYAAVPEAEIRDLVIRDKWLAAIEGTVSAAVSTTERALTARVIELDERYSVPLPTRVETVSSLAKKVEGHLTAMGVR